MLKSLRRPDQTLLLFNRSICIGGEYKFYEPSSKRWSAIELENEIRQLCTLRRFGNHGLSLGLALLWDENSGHLTLNASQFKINTFDVDIDSVDTAPAYRYHKTSEMPAVGARKRSYLRGRWSKWTGEDVRQPWARQLRCRTQSVGSKRVPFEPRRPALLRPPSERPFRRSQSAQRCFEAIRWRGQEFDMDPLWQVSLDSDHS